MLVLCMRYLKRHILAGFTYHSVRVASKIGFCSHWQLNGILDSEWCSKQFFSGL